MIITLLIFISLGNGDSEVVTDTSGTTQAITDNGTTPAVTDNGTTQAATGNGNTPAATDNATTSAATDNATTSAATDNATTPAVTDNGTTPAAIPASGTSTDTIIPTESFCNLKNIDAVNCTKIYIYINYF